MKEFRTDIERAYIAGFIDGDGSILIHFNHGKNVQPRVVAYQNKIDVLEYIQSLYGGKIYKVSTKGYWQLLITKYDECHIILKEILPYLRIKKSQAILALTILNYKLKFIDERNGKRGENSPYREEEFRLAKELSLLQSYPKRNGAYKKIYSNMLSS